MNLMENKLNDYSNIILLADELLTEGFFLQITVGGYSMFPYLQNGDDVLIKKEPINNLKTGDIIVFCSGKKLIAHRIITFRKANSQTKIITKGDSLIIFDNPITAEQYIGKITGYIRKNKSISISSPKRLLLNKFMVILSVLSIPFFIILIPFTLFSNFFKTHLMLHKK
jgi:signal peptidase I